MTAVRMEMKETTMPCWYPSPPKPLPQTPCQLTTVLHHLSLPSLIGLV